MKHTPEPWESAIALLVVHRAPDGTAERICECTIGRNAEANARRIVACVNACAGIRTEMLEAGLIRQLLGAAGDTGALT